MGLQLINFKKNGISFENAYAKVSNVQYNNDTKIATFGLSVYPSKDDKNEIHKFSFWAKPESGKDFVAECYKRIAELLSQKKQFIETTKTQLSTTTDDNQKLRLESLLKTIQVDDFLQFDGSVEL